MATKKRKREGQDPLSVKKGKRGMKGEARNRFIQSTELKVNDIASTAYACDTTGSVTLLNGVAVGDDFTTRDGRQAFMKSVQVKGLINPQDFITDNNLARIMLVWDSQPNGVIATIAMILNAATSISPTNLNNRERFTILRDKQFAVGFNNNTATQAQSNSPTVHEYQEYVRLNHKTTYSGTAGTIAEVATGALLLVTIGNLAAGSGSTFTAYTRVRFTDH